MRKLNYYGMIFMPNEEAELQENNDENLDEKDGFEECSDEKN